MLRFGKTKITEEIAKRPIKRDIDVDNIVVSKPIEAKKGILLFDQVFRQYYKIINFDNFQSIS